MHVVKRGGQFGTVSAHAATTCSIALLASLILRRGWFSLAMAVWVALVCYSRIYLAYHFPLDILYGLLLGTLWGLLSAWVFRRLKR